MADVFTTAEILLDCMENWTRAPVEKVTSTVNQAGGQLIIMNNMLAVEIEGTKMAELNKKLVEVGAEIGLPTIIDPNFRTEKKSGLWKEIYGTDCII